MKLETWSRILKIKTTQFSRVGVVLSIYYVICAICRSKTRRIFYEHSSFLAWKQFRPFFDDHHAMISITKKQYIYIPRYASKSQNFHVDVLCGFLWFFIDTSRGIRHLQYTYPSKYPQDHK